jgi:elongation factor G
MTKQLHNIRNIGIIAHIDAGKTTLTERMLYLSGAKHRVGEVDKGNTTTDDDAEEQDRGITIYAACVTFDWKDVHINLLDTPGHVDFTAEVERSLRVLDGAVVVFSAREGVEAQSETVWRQADKYQIPRIAFINKLDREGADFPRVLDEMRTRLSASPIALFIPVGQGPPHVADPFRGVIDLVEMRFLTFDPDGREMHIGPIPDKWIAEAETWRGYLLEDLYYLSNEMLSLALEEQEIPVELLRQVIRQATLSCQRQPVICGSALHGIGVQLVLDSVRHYLPSPLDRPPICGQDPTKDNVVVQRRADPDEPFCGYVFKLLPAKTGDFYWVRVYSGTLRANSRVLCAGKDKKENISQLWQIHATKKEREGQVPSVQAGDIVGVIGPRHAITGDTLCDAAAPILLDPIEFPPTVIEMAIEPDSSAERKKLAEVLEMLRRQDPTFRAEEKEELGQTLIAGMGELHLEVIRNRLLRDFNLNVKVHKPRVSYRETIATDVEVTGECHRLVSGQQLFARLALRVEPEPAAETGVRIINQLPPGTLPPSVLQAVLDQLKALGEGGGPIGSFPLAMLRVTIVDAETQETGSNEMAFSIAASDAFEQALQRGGPVLLEPIMKLVIITPDEYFGDFSADLAQRRARIVHTDSRGGMTTIEAHAPLAELFGYAGALRSLSQGRAGSSMEPLRYEPAPEQVAAGFAI